jgi:hypothetical protein
MAVNEFNELFVMNENRLTCPRTASEKRRNIRLPQSQVTFQPDHCIAAEKERVLQTIVNLEELESMYYDSMHQIRMKFTAKVDRFAAEARLNSNHELRAALKKFDEGISLLHEREASELEPFEKKLYELQIKLAKSFCELKCIAIGMKFKKDRPDLPDFFVAARTSAFLKENETKNIDYVQSGYVFLYKKKELTEYLLGDLDFFQVMKID